MIHEVQSTVIAGTGHRPDKLGGYTNWYTHTEGKLVDLISRELEQLSPGLVITGMALGFDQALAKAALALKIPFVAALPFPGQHTMWNSRAVNEYFDLLTKSEYAYLIDQERQLFSYDSSTFRNWLRPIGHQPYIREKMQKRNEWMVDNSKEILAMWDGSAGGTANCVRYAQGKGRSIINLHNKLV